MVADTTFPIILLLKTLGIHFSTNITPITERIFRSHLNCLKNDVRIPAIKTT
jgi:hypothetical protein